MSWWGIEKLLELHLPVLEYEGEKFLLTIPPTTYTYLSDSGKLGEQFISYSTYDGGVMYELNRFETEGQPPYRVIAYTTSQVSDGPLSEGVAQNVILSFRLMLVPLDKNGHIDVSFRKQNEDGLIFRSGFLRIKCGREDESLTKDVYICNADQTDRFNDLIRVWNGLKCELVEQYPADTAPLEWVCWDGCLITSSCVFRCTIQEAWDMGILPHL